jgi:hypothetical protein
MTDVQKLHEAILRLAPASDATDGLDGPTQYLYRQGFRDALKAAALLAEASPASRLQEQEGQPAPIAWEATTSAYIKFITQERYSRFAPAVQRWYKPYRCSSCATLAAGSQAVQVPGWRPIDSAPKNEFVLLAAEFDRPGDWRIKMGYFQNHADEFGRHWHVLGASWEPTHWMPLPPPPLQPLAGGEVGNG